METLYFKLVFQKIIKSNEIYIMPETPIRFSINSSCKPQYYITMETDKDQWKGTESKNTHTFSVEVTTELDGERIVFSTNGIKTTRYLYRKK